jgi:hypothetical protein
MKPKTSQLGNVQYSDICFVSKTGHNGRGEKTDTHIKQNKNILRPYRGVMRSRKQQALSLSLV